MFNRPLLDTATKTVVNQSGNTDFQPGDVVRYTISVTNTGTQTATAATVTDPVDANLTGVTPEDGGVFDAGSGTITWTLGDLAAGASATLHFTATIGVGVPNGTVIANQASANATNADSAPTDDPATAPDDDPTVITVEALPDLTGLSKTFVDENGGTIEPGDSILYTLTVTNDGRAVATNLVFTDTVDPAFDTIVPLDGGTLSGSTITWNLGTLAIGASATVQFRATLAASLPFQAVVANQAFATSTDTPTPIPSDDPGTGDVDDPTVFTVDNEADLGASTKTVLDLNGGAVQPGDVLEYTVEVRNDGDAPATNVVVSDPIDPNLTDVVPADGGVFDGTAITWNVPAALAPGDTVLVTFTATVNAATASGTDIANQASMTATGLVGSVLSDDPNTPAADDPTIVTVVRQPDFVTTPKTVENLDGGAESSRATGFAGPSR